MRSWVRSTTRPVAVSDTRLKRSVAPPSRVVMYEAIIHLPSGERDTPELYDLETASYHREDLPFFMEIASLSGSVTEMNGKPYIHLHTALADQQNKTHAGHVIELTIGATCEMFVRVLPGEVIRKKDEAVGLNLWSF